MSYRVPLAESRFKLFQEELKPLVPGFDLVLDHIIITDENGVILYANKAVEKITGFKPEDIIRKNPGDLWGGNMTDDFYQKMWRDIKVFKKPFIGEVQNKRHDGTFYYQQISITPVLDDDNNIKFFIGIEPDITIRKNIEKEFKAACEATIEFNKLMIRREIKMIELKEEIKKLQEKLKLAKEDLSNLKTSLNKRSRKFR